MKPFLLALILFAFNLPNGELLAAEAETDTGTSENKDTKAAGKDSKEGSGEDAPSSEIFIPSEEISEDFAVPFPVDI